MVKVAMVGWSGCLGWLRWLRLDGHDVCDS